jgi:hypothetical protein
MGRMLIVRRVCLCCVAGTTFAATGKWLTPTEVFAETRGTVSLIKDSAAVSPIVVHKLRNNVSVMEGSGGNIAVLTGPDGKVIIDASIGVSRPQITKALADLGHANGNEWLHSIGAKIIAQENTRKHLSEIQEEGPAHTDGDISVTFAETDIVHVAPTPIWRLQQIRRSSFQGTVRRSAIDRS